MATTYCLFISRFDRKSVPVCDGEFIIAFKMVAPKWRTRFFIYWFWIDRYISKRLWGCNTNFTSECQFKMVAPICRTHFVATSVMLTLICCTLYRKSIVKGLCDSELKVYIRKTQFSRQRFYSRWWQQYGGQLTVHRLCTLWCLETCKAANVNSTLKLKFKTVAPIWRTHFDHLLYALIQYGKLIPLLYALIPNVWGSECKYHIKLSIQDRDTNLANIFCYQFCILTQNWHVGVCRIASSVPILKFQFKMLAPISWKFLSHYDLYGRHSSAFTVRFDV